MTTSPYTLGAINADATRTYASLGAGYRIGGVYFNVAWRTAWWAEDYYFMGSFDPISSEALPAGELQRRNSALMVGAGIRL
jgi:hypothetical protein